MLTHLPESSETTRRAQHHQAQPSPSHLTREQSSSSSYCASSSTAPPTHATHCSSGVLLSLPRVGRRVLAREDRAPDICREWRAEEVRRGSRGERVD